MSEFKVCHIAVHEIKMNERKHIKLFILFIGSPVVTSADLDVTLMVCLLRNFPPYVSPPASGFDALPLSNDLSHGAHIARIKYFKNFIVSHSKDGKLSDLLNHMENIKNF